MRIKEGKLWNEIEQSFEGDVPVFFVSLIETDQGSVIAFHDQKGGRVFLSDLEGKVFKLEFMPVYV